VEDDSFITEYYIIAITVYRIPVLYSGNDDAGPRRRQNVTPSKLATRRGAVDELVSRRRLRVRTPGRPFCASAGRFGGGGLHSRPGNVNVDNPTGAGRPVVHFPFRRGEFHARREYNNPMT